MGIGASITLLALGAILTFALNSNDVDFVDIDVVGVILMIAGAIGLAITLAYLNRARSVAATRGTVVEDRVTRERDVY